MTEEEIQELIQNAFQKTAKELKENPDNVFNYLKLQEKYNEVLKDKVKLKKENQELKDTLSKVKHEVERKITFCSAEAEGHINPEKCNTAIHSLRKLLEDLKDV